MSKLLDNNVSKTTIKNVETTSGLIDIGTTKEEVRRIMGTPSSIQNYGVLGTTWWYGLSTISFDENGKVDGWENTDKNIRLK